MNLKQMEYFVAIVNEGNISAAAKSLHISQPPLSAQMKLFFLFLSGNIKC